MFMVAMNHCSCLLSPWLFITLVYLKQLLQFHLSIVYLFHNDESFIRMNVKRYCCIARFQEINWKHIQKNMFIQVIDIRSHEYYSTLHSLFYHICTSCIKMTSVSYTLVLCVNIRKMERETILPLTMEELGVRKTFLIEY